MDHLRQRHGDVGQGHGDQLEQLTFQAGAASCTRAQAAIRLQGTEMSPAALQIHLVPGG